MSTRMLAMLVALMLPCGFATAGDYTRDDAVKMVEKAAAFLSSNGKNKLIAEVNVRKAGFTR